MYAINNNKYILCKMTYTIQSQYTELAANGHSRNSSTFPDAAQQYHFWRTTHSTNISVVVQTTKSAHCKTSH